MPTTPHRSPTTARPSPCATPRRRASRSRDGLPTKLLQSRSQPSPAARRETSTYTRSGSLSNTPCSISQAPAKTPQETRSPTRCSTATWPSRHPSSTRPLQARAPGTRIRCLRTRRRASSRQAAPATKRSTDTRTSPNRNPHRSRALRPRPSQILRPRPARPTHRNQNPWSRLAINRVLLHLFAVAAVTAGAALAASFGFRATKHGPSDTDEK